MDIDVNELLLTALRATFVYFYLLLIVRILGKREIGASSAFDLLVALMLGDVVDEIIYGDVTIIQGASGHGHYWSLASGQFLGKFQESAH